MEGYTELKTQRYERKFVADKVPRTVAESIVKQNSAFFAATFPARQVNNIYFDTPGMDCYFDNLFGVSHRWKVRIRWYGKMFGKIKRPILEFKIKKAFTGTKKSFELPDFELPSDGFEGGFRYSWFSSAGLPDEVLAKLFGLQPVLLNGYERSYFESRDKKFRITVDNKMEYFNLNPAWNHFLHGYKEFAKTVIELKYDAVWQDDAESITNQFPFRVDKNSKYISGVSYFRGVIPH
jgi:hypothetical protein